MNIFDLDSFLGEASSTFSNSNFVEKLGDVLGKKYPLDELIDLFESLESGEEKEWIAHVDLFLETAQVEEEMGEYIEEMDQLREMVRTYLSFFLISPRILFLIRAMIVFILEALKNAGVNSLSELKKLENEKSEVWQIFTRIFQTIQKQTLLTVVTRIPQFIIGEEIEPLQWESRHEIPKVMGVPLVKASFQEGEAKAKELEWKPAEGTEGKEESREGDKLEKEELPLSEENEESFGGDEVISKHESLLNELEIESPFEGSDSFNYDEGAWKEFNQYLIDRGDVFSTPESKGQGSPLDCLIM